MIQLFSVFQQQLSLRYKRYKNYKFLSYLQTNQIFIQMRRTVKSFDLQLQLTMKVKINELQDQLSKAIIEEQLLKSENVMLTKELQRLKKRQQKNNQYTNINSASINQKQQYYKQVKDNLQQKHNKNVALLDSKISNCQETLVKLRKLITTSANDFNIKQNMPNNLEQTYKSGSSKVIKQKEKEESIYSYIKCEDCYSVMAPCQYFNHLQNNVCPCRKQMI